MSEIKLKMKLITPSVPSFICVQSKPGLRQEGFQEALSISIADLPKDTLEEIAKKWKEDLLAKAELLKASAESKP